MSYTIPNPSRPLSPIPAVTDRALRYRANATPPPGPRVCNYCGSSRAVEIEHIDGQEEHTAAENLLFACRSCNTRKGTFFAKNALGRKTRQYNPSAGRRRATARLNSGKGVSSVKGWLDAARSIQGVGGSLTARQAIAAIQATPPAKRARFGEQLARVNPEQEIGPHGPIYRQFRHDAAGAIRKLKAEKTGEAVAALYHPEIGDIDLIWGKSGKRGYGLAHILERPHRKPIVNRLQEFLSKMRIVPDRHPRPADELRLSDGLHVAIVSRVWQAGKRTPRTDKTWLLTAFYDAKENPEAIRRKVSPRSRRSRGGHPPPGGSKSKLRRPAKKNNPPPTYEQYLFAVRTHQPGAHDEGGAIIHATPKAKRSEYARKIAAVKRRHGTDRRGRREEVPF